MVNLEVYGQQLSELHLSYIKQRNRLDAYNHSHYIFEDGTKIEWTPEQQAKALAEAQADVTALATIVATIKTSLDMV